MRAQGPRSDRFTLERGIRGRGMPAQDLNLLISERGARTHVPQSVWDEGVSAETLGHDECL